MSDERDRPTTDQPLNADRRPRFRPLLAVVGLLVLLALLYFVISWLRYHT